MVGIVRHPGLKCKIQNTSPRAQTCFLYFNYLGWMLVHLRIPSLLAAYADLYGLLDLGSPAG